jgi:hypothetical protein
VLALLAPLVVACDLGAPTGASGRGPDLHVVATYPENGAGTECGRSDPDDCGVPVDSPIEVRFDRFILPKTAVRQSLRVYSGRPDQALRLEPVYDVVERVVTYRTAPGVFERGLLYQVDIALPEENSDGFGFRAFDWAPLVESGEIPLHFSFRTARAAPGDVPPPAPPSCNDVLSVLSASECGLAPCHAGPKAQMGLRLDSGLGLRETAISRVARETEGPNAGATIVDPARFGVGMPLIDPGGPSSSYLVYKLLTKPENFGSGDAACRTSHLVPLREGTCLTPPQAERSRLGDWFVRLDPMPPGSGSLTHGTRDLRTLTDFIRAGASTSDCE